MPKTEAGVGRRGHTEEDPTEQLPEGNGEDEEKTEGEQETAPGDVREVGGSERGC